MNASTPPAPEAPTTEARTRAHAAHAAGRYGKTLQALEQTWGSAAGAGPLGWAEALDRDEREAFPAEALFRLAAHDAPALQIPRAEGGRFESFEQLLALAWTLGRRDPALALTQGMQTWVWLVRMLGTPAQQERGRALLARNGSPCFAASELAHGADLLATETVAVLGSDGWRISGEKAPLGRARDAAVALVLARTRAATGPRALSWFMVELDHGSVTRLPRLATVGLRAADLGGLRFVGTPATPLGAEGAGLEHALRIFQITRPLVASLALGAGDTALRIATRFALERTLYGGRATDLPSVRRSLAQAWLDLLAAEILLLGAVRGLHAAPEQMSLVAPLAKALAPQLVARGTAAASMVLGARGFLRGGASGIFQKMARDQAAAGLIDGSTPVCLHAVAGQLPALLGRRAEPAGDLDARLCLAREVPPFDPGRLCLAARGLDDVTRQADDDAQPILAELAAASEGRRSQDLLGEAERFALVHTALCCRRFERHNRALPLCAAGLPALAARRLLSPQDLPAEATEAVFERLAAAVTGERLLSIVEGPAP
jgi:alkylation response protein AidB-like acyl-CoA dehydrogenase